MTKKTKKSSTPATALLAHFPNPPPEVPTSGAGLPRRGEPGSWADEFERLPVGPATPSLVGTHWVNAKKEFWRFERDGKMTYGLSGGIFTMDWSQRAPWLFIVDAGPMRSAEILACVDGDALAGYHRSQLGMSTLEYRRADAAVIDEYIRSKQAFQAWVVGPRDKPQPPLPPWPPRSSSPSVAAAPALRFANYRAERALGAMSAAEQRHLATHATTIAEQAEFGGVEAIDLLDGDAVAYQLYWWPVTNGILVDAATGAVVADLLDGSLSIDDAALRARLEAGYDCGPLPKALSIRFV